MSFDSIDLKELLDEEGIKYGEDQKNVILRKCPTCGKEDKVYIDKKTKIWFCYVCKESGEFGKGSLWKLLELFGWDRERIRQRLAGSDLRICGDMSFQAMEKKEPEPWTPPAQSPEPMLPLFNLPSRFIQLNRTQQQLETFQDAYLYLWKRGFKTKEQYQRWQPMFDPASKRVIFPCRNHYGMCVGFQARDITNRCNQKHPRCSNGECSLRWKHYFIGESPAPPGCPVCGSQLELARYPKTKNNHDLPKQNFFFGEDTVDWGRPVVLVEGPFDATNVENSIALLGKSLSYIHLKILLARAFQIVIYFDGDLAGRKAASGVYEQLRPFLDVKIVSTPEGTDPGERTIEDNRVFIESALQPQEWHIVNKLIAI